jgi:ABC-type branched-subunit amino acid transport system ATPase component
MDSRRFHLMETGKILASGPAQELVEDKVLSNAFLGAEATKS